jgi:hypothetical protein
MFRCLLEGVQFFSCDKLALLYVQTEQYDYSVAQSIALCLFAAPHSVEQSAVSGRFHTLPVSHEMATFLL